MDAWDKSPMDRLTHHLGNIFVGGALALGLWWGAAWLASQEWNQPLLLEAMRWLTAAIMFLVGGGFWMFVGAAVRNLTLSPEEARSRYGSVTAASPDTVPAAPRGTPESAV